MTAAPLHCQTAATQAATTWPTFVHYKENELIRSNVEYAAESRGGLMSVRVAVMVSAIQEHVAATDRRVS
jgi:hypothetical protein